MLSVAAGALLRHPAAALDHIQRPGLLLANNTIYIGFGSHGDFPPWHGWIVAYNAADIQQQTAVFNTTPSAAGSSIWQGGRGLAADPDGHVYCSTGNGNYDGVMSWGETVLRLTPTLDVADWFTPAEYAAWTDDDVDFGSNGPILVPGTNFVIAGGKAGLVALVDRTNMGHEGADTDALQEVLHRCAGQRLRHIQHGALESSGRPHALSVGQRRRDTPVSNAERLIQYHSDSGQ